MESTLLRVFCALTGYEYRILKNYDSVSRRKIAIYALAMLIPTLIWTINSYILVNVVLHDSVKAGIVTALICGILIFVIERIIIMSTGNWLVSGFRLLLGCTTAILASFTLKMMIFAREVQAELDKRRLDSLPAIRRQVEQIHTADYQDMASRLSAADSAFRANTILGEKEMNGFPVTVRPDALPVLLSRPGLGPKARHYFQKADSIGRYVMAPLYAKRDSLNARVQDEVDAYQRQQAANEGLMTRLDVFFDLLRDGKRKFVFWLLFTAFLCLELTVITLKMGLQKTAFEKDELLINQMH